MWNRFMGKGRTIHCFGGVILRSLIAVVTLAVIGTAIMVILNNYGQRQEVLHRKAIAISEYGLLVALQKIQASPDESAEQEKTVYDDGWFRVQQKQYEKRDTLFLKIVAEGHAGSVVERRECILSLDRTIKETRWVRQSMR